MTGGSCSAQQRVARFRFLLLRKMPFYGDILMRMPISPDPSAGTALTDGGRILYNPAFFDTLSDAEMNFVLMHEVFHVLLFHCRRAEKRDPALWNIATDIIVNHYLMRLSDAFRNRDIPFARPADGIFVRISENLSAEFVYDWLQKGNNAQLKGKTVTLKDSMVSIARSVVYPLPCDIIFTEKASGGAASDEKGLSENAIRALINEAAIKNRGSFGSCYIPDQLLALSKEKPLPWQTLLRSFLDEAMDEEVSYHTPERKYLHMDMILPGHGMAKNTLEDVWAFVDSSGSVSKEELSRFLTELWHIVKRFGCKMNLCYWDTEVTDVYTNIQDEKALLQCLPRHSGGTDINCVYRWLQQKHIKPGVMLILTDGYFGIPAPECVPNTLRRKTILALSSDVITTKDMLRIGAIARLKMR